MAEIELKKRAVYAGDVHIALLKAGWSIREACDFVNGLPKADVAPVRHGRWVPFHSAAAGDIWYCSDCEVGSDWRSGFCPNCGARMDGGADNGET